MKGREKLKGRVSLRKRKIVLEKNQVKIIRTHVLLPLGKLLGMDAYKEDF